MVDSAGDGFFVERPEVFRRAAAAADDEDVDVVEPVEVGDGSGYFGGGPRALDSGRAQYELKSGCPAAEDLDYVADCGARR